MSHPEAIMWAVEKDPSLRSDFVNITMLDGVPDEARLRAKVARAVQEIPRLGERVVAPPLRLAPPEWQPDPTLDLDYHLRRVSAPPPGGRRELLDLAALLSSAPLDRSRPLWEFTLVEGLADGKAALLQRVHHTITDGVGGLKLSLSLVDLERDPDDSPPVPAGAPRPAETPRSGPVDVIAGAVSYTLRRERDLVRAGVGAVAGLALHPLDLPRRTSETVHLAGSVRRQIFVTEPARSPAFTHRSLGRRFEVYSIPLDAAQHTAKALGGTINDVYVTGVAGALGLYHDRLGCPVDELRMAMPVSTRERSDSSANRFAPSRTIIPVVPRDPADRLRMVQQRLRAVRDEPVLAAAESLSGALALLPTAVLVTVTRTQARTIDFATSNLRGSPVDLYIGGARIEANYPMGPRAGCPLNVTLLSYCGELHMGLNLDPAAVTRPDVLLECLDEAFEPLLAAG
jgi:WS/DGAT/MGAT family acyltransferase